MALINISHRLDPAAVRQLVSNPQGGVFRDLIRRGLLVETQAKRNLGGIGGPRRIDTGRLRASGHTQVVMSEGQPAVIVAFPVRYSRWVHDGTGLYGPRRTLIKPKHATRLRFKPRGSRRYVYAKAVKGMKPNRFLLNALKAARY